MFSLSSLFPKLSPIAARSALLILAAVALVWGLPSPTHAAAIERITVDGMAPYHTSREPFRDERGRTYVTVDFMPGAEAPYVEQARDALANFRLGRDREHPVMLLLIEDYERRYGIEAHYTTDENGTRRRSNVTTWVGASVSTYLDDAQIKALREDTNIRLVSDVTTIEFSTSSPPWSPSWNGTAWGELNDWGWVAVEGKSLLPGSTRKVYVIDSGIAAHDDLGSVSSRVSFTDPARASPMPTRLVGCYTHGTHVAGIIGATENNGIGRRGVYAGVNMISLTGGEDQGQAYNGGTDYYCNSSPMNSAELGFALDYVVQNGLQVWNATPMPHIVNLSSNRNAQTGFDSSGTPESNWTKIVNLVTPGYVFAPFFYMHPGHVLVQSAGNAYVDSCDTNNPGYSASYSFKTSFSAQSTAVDGVIVVGALNASGSPVGGGGTFANAYPLFSDPPPGVTGPPPWTFPGAAGSNYGKCVDLWAPGNDIYSTWGKGYQSTNILDEPYGGGEPAVCAGMGCISAPHSGWAWLSGTSMAAPHVAAAAAYVADKYALTTPAAIEQALRNAWKTLSGTDAAYEPVRMVQLP